MNDAPPGPEPAEPAVDSDAVELPAAGEPAVPVTVYHAPAQPGAPGAMAPSFDGHASEPPADPLEPIKILAAERPELAVGAAFAGGILAAMILRRLGN